MLYRLCSTRTTTCTSPQDRPRPFFFWNLSATKAQFVWSAVRNDEHIRTRILGWKVATTCTECRQERQTRPGLLVSDATLRMLRVVLSGETNTTASKPSDAFYRMLSWIT